jgi:hypothetical protein
VSKIYDFTASGAGLYTFQPKDYFYLVDPHTKVASYVTTYQSPAPEHVVSISDTLVVKADEDTQDVEGGGDAPGQVHGTQFLGPFTDAQKAEIGLAIQEANTYITTSRG